MRHTAHMLLLSALLLWATAITILNAHPQRVNDGVLGVAAALIVLGMFSVRAKRENLKRRYGYMG